MNIIKYIAKRGKIKDTVYDIVLDEEGLTLYNLHRWYVSKDFYNHYSLIRKDENNKTIRFHREIMNAPDKMEVDHINGNPLDNRRINLRVVTHSQNMMNSKMRKDNSSGHRCVYWEKTRNKWRTEITINGKTKYIGRYKNYNDACDAYDKEANILFGEYLGAVNDL